MKISVSVLEPLAELKIPDSWYLLLVEGPLVHGLKIQRIRISTKRK